MNGESIIQMLRRGIWFGCGGGPCAGRIETNSFVSGEDTARRHPFGDQPIQQTERYNERPTASHWFVFPVPDATDILKCFFEEPVLLEPTTPDRDPDARRREERPARGPGASGPSLPIEALLQTDDYYRAYIAGTNLRTGAVGLTTLSDAGLYADPLWDALGEAWWARAVDVPQGVPEDEAANDAGDAGAVEVIDAEVARGVLSRPEDTTVLVTAPAPVAAERIEAVMGTARRDALRPLRVLLDEGAVAFFTEPAHDGVDWSIFAARPMRDRLIHAMRRHPAPEARRFVLPYQKARSESKFYFETWQLTEPSLPDYIEEV